MLLCRLLLAKVEIFQNNCSSVLFVFLKSSPRAASSIVTFQLPSDLEPFLETRDHIIQPFSAWVWCCVCSHGVSRRFWAGCWCLFSVCNFKDVVQRWSLMELGPCRRAGSWELSCEDAVRFLWTPLD